MAAISNANSNLSDLDRMKKCVQSIHEILPELKNTTPTVGIVCGSGLSKIVDNVKNPREVNYSDIEGFPVPGYAVDGHKMKFVFGTLNGIPVACMLGRFHFYQGMSMRDVAFPMRVMAGLGVKTVVMTNAAGGLAPKLNVGDIVVLSDHVSIPMLSGQNPLIGPNEEELGPRFIAVSDAYDVKLQRLVLREATALGFKLYLPNLIQQEFDQETSPHSESTGDSSKPRIHINGIYGHVGGPSYETPAEGRLLKLVGADVVGMSTVPEVIVARHMGMNVLGISLVTNCVVMGKRDLLATSTPSSPKQKSKTMASIVEEKANHEEVLNAVEMATPYIGKLVENVIMKIHPKTGISTSQSATNLTFLG